MAGCRPQTVWEKETSSPESWFSNKARTGNTNPKGTILVLSAWCPHAQWTPLCGPSFNAAAEGMCGPGTKSPRQPHEGEKKKQLYTGLLHGCSL